PFRVFEFVLGALCVKLNRRFPPRTVTAEILFLTGLALIGYALFFFRENMHFPGFNALVPCLGAALILHSGAQARYARMLLANRPVVGLGLISYSLYLIHWPLIVYYKYWSFDSTSVPETAALVAASVIAAIPMYFFIEQPFRLPGVRAPFLPPAKTA